MDGDEKDERRAARAQMKKDNARVPRDWRNDPAWLRDLLQRTWDAIGDRVDSVFPLETEEERDAYDLLHGHVLFVLTPPGGFAEDK